MGKSSSATVGYHYRPAYHAGLGRGPIDAFLEFRGGDRTAWAGVLTASGTITINAPNLFGGEKDQGGIVGDVDVMFGEADQEPNPYLIATFGPQIPAWRGVATLVFKGGRYGAMNPYPQKASYKIRKILQGWGGEGCWYPEKAAVTVYEAPADSVPWVDAPDPRAPFAAYEYRYDGGSWHASQAAAIAEAVSLGADPEEFTNLMGWSPDGQRLARAYGFVPSDEESLFLHFNRYVVTHALGYVDILENTTFGLVCGPMFDNDVATGSGRFWWANDRGDGPDLPAGLYSLVAYDELDDHPHEVIISNCTMYPYDPVAGGFPTAIRSTDAILEIRRVGGSLYGMNPAHALYYVRTDSEYGREPRENLNEASLQAAADTLHAEGFGICTAYDPSQESPLEFESRICRLIGGSFGRSLTDGQWYLDLARGDYDIEDLPVLTDDDILEFKELPSTLDGAVNSVAVKYFDPERKEVMVTPAVRALGLIRRFGENHLVLECPEIPTASLALRKAEMELRSRVTPTRAFDLVTTRRTYNWRPNQYFRLQTVKRGIADMVCLVGEIGTGTLRSGAIRLKATQDIYSLPATSYVEVEAGVDTRPPQTPSAIVHQAAFEAPYVELAQRMTRADLNFLTPDVGYLMAVAADPANSRDFTMMVREAGGDFVASGNGDWCPTAVVVEAAGRDDDTFTLADGVGLGGVRIGQAALWGSEICRVDGISPLVLGRGCADTVPVGHAAGERIWFYDDEFAGDITEYSAGEVVDVRLVTNTGSQQLAINLASNIELELGQRQARPYAPGAVTVNGSASPAYLSGLVTLSWVHRDRLQQADQLVDHGMAGIGPEAGTTYTVRWYLDDVLEHTDSGITGTTATYTYGGDGNARVELESERDGLASWQFHVREFDYTVTAGVPWELQDDGVLQQQNENIIFLMG